MRGLIVVALALAGIGCVTIYKAPPSTEVPVATSVAVLQLLERVGGNQEVAMNALVATDRVTEAEAERLVAAALLTRAKLREHAAMEQGAAAAAYIKDGVESGALPRDPRAAPSPSPVPPAAAPVVPPAASSSASPSPSPSPAS